jgi:ADP-heptose:LPS heptosyltransferase
MTVSSMRRIDRWVGVPLCFILSLLNSLVALFKSKRVKPDNSRTLFIELSEMGSAILVDPAMRKLQREAGAELYFVIFEDNYKSLEILNTVPKENIFTIRSNNLFILAGDTLRFASWCRRKKITTVIDLELFSRFTAMLSFFSGASSRVGFTNFHDEGLYRGNLVNFRVRYNPHVHIAVNFISLVNTAMGLHDTPYPTTPVKPSELILQQAEINPALTDNVRKKIRNLFPQWESQQVILFNVNASDMLTQRRWPQENFAMVAKELLKQFEDILVIATGAPSERAYVQEVVNMIGHERCLNSAGVFLFEELVPLYSISNFMITNDSGPAHFASVTNLKIFVLFGPETPALYGPLGNAETFYLGLPCSPCVSAANHRKTTCIPRPCITGIQPSFVLGRLKNYLLSGNPQRKMHNA